jgi:hypothetical protein
MVKELKYVLYLSVIFIFLFFVIKYYFSDQYKKISYRSYINQTNKIEKFSSNLKLLKSNTKNIIEYVENKQNKKKYYFWNLLNDNEK